MTRIADKEQSLRESIQQFKNSYGSGDDAEEAYNKDLADLLKEARRTKIRSSMIRSVVGTYMSDNNIRKINEDNVEDILDLLAEKLGERDSTIIISDELKREVRNQLEDSLIKDNKGLGYDKKDITATLETILGKEGLVKTTVERSVVNEAVSEFMKSKGTRELRDSDVDDMLEKVQDEMRLDLPESVKDSIKQEIADKRMDPDAVVNRSTVSKIINSEIRRSGIEDRADYHKSLNRRQVEELIAAGIDVGTPEYYQYLQDNNIRGNELEREKARNEAKKHVRELETLNEKAKVKLGGSLVSIGKSIKDI